MPDTLKAGDFGVANGVSLSVGSTQICKVINTTTQTALIIKVTLDKGSLITIPDTELPVNSLTFKAGTKDDDVTDTDNIFKVGTTDIYFCVKKQSIFLNIQVPVEGTKHTTGFKIAKVVKKIKKKSK